MKTKQSGELRWFKSTYSGGDGRECVETSADRAAIRIRDSKKRGGPQLAFTHHAWTRFIADVGQSAPE